MNKILVACKTQIDYYQLFVDGKLVFMHPVGAHNAKQAVELVMHGINSTMRALDYTGVPTTMPDNGTVWSK